MKPRLLFWDVETSPILGYTFGIYETNVAHTILLKKVLIGRIMQSINDLSARYIIESLEVRQTY